MRKKDATILIVDDDKDILFSSRVWLKRFFTEIITTNIPSEINLYFNEHTIHVVLLDMNYRKGFEDGKEGLYWLKYIKEISPDTAVVLMTAFGDVNLAVESIKKGATDFILKPWNNEKLYASINAAVDLSRKNKKINQLEKIQEQSDDLRFIGNSPQIQSALQLAEKVAPTDASVLILGENGTGKYVYAKELHRLSLRKNEPFVHVDLGALSEQLFESELFGYAKGAYTDAKEDTPGRFELADGGTIFLDEIGNLSSTLQTKLLTVIQNRTINRLGETKMRKVDVRIICATNASIPEMVKKGIFRQDLLFRINTIEVTLPPLRKRGKDIQILTDYFLNKYTRKYQKPNLFIGENVRKELEEYTWPGNIRELENMLERAVILVDTKEITHQELYFSSLPVHETETSLNLEQMEYQLIKRALQKHQRNITHAADELGLTRAALYRRMEKHNLHE